MAATKLKLGDRVATTGTVGTGRIVKIERNKYHVAMAGGETLLFVGMSSLRLLPPPPAKPVRFKVGDKVQDLLAGPNSPIGKVVALDERIADAVTVLWPDGRRSFYGAPGLLMRAP
jgi:hypothetical protein